MKSTQKTCNVHGQRELLRLGPNATYIPLTRVGFLRWVMQILKFAFWVTQIFSFFRYQHVGISNTKLWRWGSKPTPVPNANVFLSQWNIGFSVNGSLHVRTQLQPRFVRCSTTKGLGMFDMHK